MYSDNSIIRRVLMTSATAFALLALPASCSTMRPRPMVSGAGVPASEGTVNATAGDNGNTNLEVRVKHLAPPEKVAADATVYVVWIQPRGEARQSVGALRLNDNLEGHLDTVTPHRQFLVSVTPEPSGQVARPSHEAVFTSDVSRDD